MKEPKNYYIDFIGQGKVMTVADTVTTGQEGREQAKAPKVRTAAQPKKDAFGAGPSEPLPPPSILNGASRLIEPEAGDKGAGKGSPVLADFSNFPYPWYITQVRESLWNSWTERMPSSGSLKCTVKFEIRRNGSVGALSVEDSSGNRLFDNAAESAVEGAAPFPGLPDDYYEDALTVHVEFKTTD